MNRIKDDSKKKTSRRQSIALLTAGGYWFQFPKYFLHMMPANEAILLAFLMNHAQLMDAETKNDGWFYCKVSKIQENLNFNHDKQRRLVQALERLGYLRVSRQGIPPKRFFWVDFDKAWADMSSKMGLE